MSDELIATNPQTGKQVRWNGKVWEPYVSSGVQQSKPISFPSDARLRANPEPDTWLEQAIHDVKRGTQETVLGRLLHKMGAQGTESGASKGESEFMGGPLFGPLEASSGGEKILSGHPIKGANEVVQGVMHSFGPAGPALALMNPGTAVPAIVAQQAVSKGTKALGANDDWSELIGNAAGLVTGVGQEKISRAGWRAVTGTGKTFQQLAQERYAKSVADYKKALDDAKTERWGAEAKDLTEKNKADAAYKLKVDEINRDHATRVAQDRAAYQKKVEQLNKQKENFQNNQATARQKFDFQHQQGPDFQRVSGMANQLANDNLPKTFKAAKAATDANWDAFRLSLGDRAVPQAPLFEAITDAEDNILSGSHERVALFRDILKDAEAGNPLNDASVFRGAGRQARGGQIDPMRDLAPDARNRFLASLSEADREVLMPKDFQLPSENISFDEARRTMTALNRAEQRALNSGHGDVYRAVKSVKDSWESVIDGRIPEELKPRYDALKQDYSQFARDWYSKKSPVKRLMEAATDKDRIDLISGKNADNLSEILDRYKGDTSTAAKIRALKQQVDSLKVRSVAEPKEINQADINRTNRDAPQPPEHKELAPFERPSPPEAFNMYKARLRELEDLFHSMADPMRTASEGPNRFGLIRGASRRIKASQLSDPTRREFIASDRQVPDVERIKALLVSILGSQAASGSSGGR